MCPHTTKSEAAGEPIHVSAYYNEAAGEPMCPHTTTSEAAGEPCSQLNRTAVYVSAYYYMCLHTTICVRMLLYMCPHTSASVAQPRRKRAVPRGEGGRGEGVGGVAADIGARGAT